MLIGHDKQRKYFKNVIANDVLAHAYLFSGPEMIGKKAFAFELARALIGDDLERNPDFRFIAPRTEEGESKIYIEDIRDLKKFLSLKSYAGGRRIIIFDDAHSLTPEAANALLKVLEEPPTGSVIFLISSAPDMIPETILSRCEEVRFSEASKKELEDYLVGKKLKKKDEDFLTVLARGRIGLAHRLIETGRIPEAQKAVDELRKLFKAGVYEKIEYAKRINETHDYQSKVDYWLSWVSAHIRQSPKNEKIVKDLLALHKLIAQPQFNHRLALENFLLNL